MPNVGLPEIMIVLVIALVVFGPKRLPELGRSMGKSFREFKGAVGGDEDDGDTHIHELPKSKVAAQAVEPVEGEIVTEKRA